MQKEFCAKIYYFSGRENNISYQSIQIKLCQIIQGVLNQNHMIRVQIGISSVDTKKSSFGILDYL